MKKIFYFVALMTALCLNFSCSSENDYPQDENKDAREVMEQKIMNLAEEYGLNLTIDKSKPFDENCNMDSIEALFKGLAKVRGKYQLSVSKKDGVYETKELPHPIRRNAITRAAESFTFGDCEVPADGYLFVCHCTVRWNTHKDAVSDAGCITAYVEERANMVSGYCKADYNCYGCFSGVTFRGTVEYHYGRFREFIIVFEFSGDCTEKGGSISWL